MITVHSMSEKFDVRKDTLASLLFHMPVWLRIKFIQYRNIIVKYCWVGNADNMSLQIPPSPDQSKRQGPNVLKWFTSSRSAFNIC